MEIFVTNFGNSMNAWWNVNDSHVFTVVVFGARNQLLHEKMRQQEMAQIVDRHLWLEAVCRFFIRCRHDARYDECLKFDSELTITQSVLTVVNQHVNSRILLLNFAGEFSDRLHVTRVAFLVENLSTFRQIFVHERFDGLLCGGWVSYT